MKIIPVIDLKDGVVVQARQGKREHYLPIKSDLCQSCDIYQVIEAFLDFYPFTTLYIADLNAITRQGDHEYLIAAVQLYFPHIIFWIDRGYQSYGQLIHYPNNYLPVLGSESYQNENISELKTFKNNFILSLDYSISDPLGADLLFSNEDLWPENIIIMTLERVGSNNGADLDKLTTFCKRYPHKNFIAAGGIRNIGDLQALKQIGIHQALIATALHAGNISGQDIQNI
jgi:phosphoribosylformimino-5-aminoimidazole carboxamide ribotide isomerase